jgi:hypothetical protein
MTTAKQEHCTDNTWRVRTIEQAQKTKNNKIDGGDDEHN